MSAGRVAHLGAWVARWRGPTWTKRGPSLFRRLHAVNAAVLVLAALAGFVARGVVQLPDTLERVIVLTGGLVVVLSLTGLLVLWALAPLQALIDSIRRIDLLERGQRLPAAAPAELGKLVEALNQLLDRYYAQQWENSRRALAAHEAERRQLALGLHDEIGQELTAVLLQLKRIGDGARGELRREVADAQHMVRKTLGEVGRIVHELRPSVLEDLGLACALNELISTFSQHTELTVRRRLDVPLPSLRHEAELAIYRVAQESLTNVARHAGASDVEVALHRAPDSLRLRVRDDGRGIDGHAAGVGIHGMRERSMLIGARVEIRGRATGGTEVAMDVPIAANLAENVASNQDRVDGTAADSHPAR